MTKKLEEIDGYVESVISTLHDMAKEVGGEFHPDPRQIKLFAEASRKSRERFISEQDSQ